MEYEQISVTDGEGISLVTLNRPERMNAWTARMGRELSHALQAADADDDTRVVVLTGAGKAFCAGADLESGGSTFDASSRDPEEVTGPKLTLPWQIRKPVVAAINGHAVGVGITYPLAADVRFVAENAKIQFAFVRRGVIPELSSHVLLSRVAGVSIAADLLLSGRQISGRDAADLGIAAKALPAAEVLSAAMAWARDLAVNAAPGSVAITKRILWAEVVPALQASERREKAPFAWLGQQADAKEGITAFLEKRAPRWTLRVSGDLPDFPFD
jgi:enoyl-CoA hydratase/carnithine racemase